MVLDGDRIVAVSQLPRVEYSVPESATVIVEAGEKSGSLHQGWEALRLGRPLFLFESLLRDASLSWPAEMERYGAQAYVTGGLDSLFEFLPERSRGEASELAF